MATTRDALVVESVHHPSALRGEGGERQRDAAIERSKAGDDRPIGEQIVKASRAKFASKGKPRLRHFPDSLDVVGKPLHHRALQDGPDGAVVARPSARIPSARPRHPSNGARPPPAPQPP